MTTADFVDGALDRAVVPGFTRIGYHVRRRLRHWQPLDADAMRGRQVVVTGATAGLGLETACELARLGAALTVVGRDPERTERARATVAATAPRAEVATALADLARLDDVRALAAELRRRHDRLDVLIHNAGAITPQRSLTDDGVEVTVAAQVLGPFLLTGLLTPLLAAARPGRVLTVSSGGMYAERLDLEALIGDGQPYDGVRAYARAKRAQVALTAEWAKLLPAGLVVVHAMHPGWAGTRGLQEALPGFARRLRRVLRTPQEGADTIVWLAAADDAIRSSGGFWHDRRRRPTHLVPWTRRRDEAAEARRIWDWCVERTGFAPAAP